MTLKRNKDFFDKFLHDFEDNEAVDVVEFNMGYIPFTIERISDGVMFHLNKNNVSYSVANSMSHKPTEYTWGRLFRDSRCTDAFKPIGWVKIKNLESIHKSFNND